MALTKVTGQVIEPTTNVQVGIITATTFKGNLTGNVTGNVTGNITGNTTGTAGGLTGTPAITVGNITAVDGTFSGNVSIAKTLTYEDVTNIDSVGIVTARTGVHIDDSITHIGDTNTKLRFPAADTFSVETAATERFRIGSVGEMHIGTSSWPTGTMSKAAGRVLIGGGGDLTLWNETNSAGGGASFKLACKEGGDATKIGYVQFFGGTENTSDQKGFLKINVSDANANGIERLRITSAGNLGINIADPVSQLQVNSTRNAETDRHTAANYHLALRNPADDNGEAIGLSFGITSNTTKVGAAILHERDAGGSQGSLQFYTSGDGNSLSERLRIESNGRIAVGGFSGAGSDLHIKTAASPTVRLQDTTNDCILLSYAQDSNAHVGTYSNHDLIFDTNSTEKLRIKSDGEIIIGGTDRPVAGQGFNSASGWGGSLQLEKANPSAGNNSVPFFAITAFNGANQRFTGGISFNRSNSNTQGTQGAVNTNQQLGNIAFNGSDGTNFIQGAEIFAIPDQTFATNDGPASLVFGTVPDGTGTTAPVERLRITSAGKIQSINGVQSGGNTTGGFAFDAVDTGCVLGVQQPSSGADTNAAFQVWDGTSNNLRINYSGLIKTSKGIDFSGAQTNQSGMENEVLDHYEEGTWTPTNSIGLTLTNNNGAHFVRIGNLCTVWFDVSFSGAQDSAQCAIIQSLPFTAEDGNSYHGQSNSTWYSNTGNAKKDFDDDNTIVFIANNGTDIKIWNITGGHLRVRSWAVGRRFRGTMTYRVKS